MTMSATTRSAATTSMAEPIMLSSATSDFGAPAGGPDASAGSAYSECGFILSSAMGCSGAGRVGHGSARCVGNEPRVLGQNAAGIARRRPAPFNEARLQLGLAQFHIEPPGIDIDDDDVA